MPTTCMIVLRTRRGWSAVGRDVPWPSCIVHRVGVTIDGARLTARLTRHGLKVPTLPACTTRHDTRTTRDSQDDAGIRNMTPPAGPGPGSASASASASGSQIFQRWPEAEEKREMDVGRWTLDVGRWTLTSEHGRKEKFTSAPWPLGPWQVSTECRSCLASR